MSNATLIGSNRVSEAEVYQVNSVPFTKTFKPIHHQQVIEAIRAGINAVGMNVMSTEYVLANNGMRMFGVWELDSGTEEICWSMGIRNSMDKSMALGITAGTRVFICENLAFDGDFVELRRHTKGLTIEELEFMAYRAIRTLVKRLTSFQAWHLGLKQYDLSESDAKVLLVDMISNNIFPASRLPRFHDLYFEGAYDPTLWGFHESATEVLKDANLLTLPKKNKALNTILKQHIDGINADRPSPLGDFYERRSRFLHA